MATSKKINRDTVDIIIPTYENLDQLSQCVQSILAYRVYYPLRVLVVNNGRNSIEFENDEIEVLEPGHNLGWTGGISYGLNKSKSKYVVFANDDIFIPRASAMWLKHMIRSLEAYPNVGAVGPTSNVVMGNQNIWNNDHRQEFFTNFLIGFCMVVKREALDKAGGIDAMFNTGDDLDLSIRLQDAGYYLAVKNDVFVYHHGFQTGEKLYGDSSTPGGWNSQKMTDDTNKMLIDKHGFKRWWRMINPKRLEVPEEVNLDDEGDAVRRHVKGKKIIELGCGAVKTIDTAIGVDMIPKGEPMPLEQGHGKSVADIVADVTKPLDIKDADVVIARHILEHCIDITSTLKNWKKILKKGGRLIISVPDERLLDSVALNPEHVHAFTPESLKSIGELLKLKQIALEEKYNSTSFTIIFEKQ